MLLRSSKKSQEASKTTIPTLIFFSKNGEHAISFNSALMHIWLELKSGFAHENIKNLPQMGLNTQSIV